MQKKTKCILFSKTINNTSLNEINIKLNEIQIETVDHAKFLGVTIEANLKWDRDCTIKANKISRALCAMARLKNILPSATLLTIYRSLVETHLTYGILAWGNSPKKTIQRLITLQKKAVRIIVKAKYNSHTEPIFNKLKILKLEDLFKLNAAKFGWKSKNNKIPKYHTTQLRPNQEIQNNNMETRQRNNINIVPHLTELDKQTINYSVGTVWNSLPSDLRDKHTVSQNTFSNLLKNHLLSKYKLTCQNRRCYSCNQSN